MAWSFAKNKFTGDETMLPESEAELDATVTTGADTYATGGMVLAVLATYFASIRYAEIIVGTPASNVDRWKVQWDGGTPTAGKLLVLVEDQTSGVVAQAANATDFSVTPGTLRVRFKGVRLSTYSAAKRPADGSTTVTNGVG